MKHLKDASEELTSKLLSALDHAVQLKKDGIDPMMPFVFVYSDNNGRLKSFVGDTPEYADKMFERTIMEENPDFAIYGYDGYLTFDGNKNDAILLKAYQKTDDVIYLVGQRFIPKSDHIDCKMIGNPAFLGTEPNNFYIDDVIKQGNEMKSESKQPWWKIW